MVSLDLERSVTLCEGREFIRVGGVGLEKGEWGAAGKGKRTTATSAGKDGYWCEEYDGSYGKEDVVEEMHRVDSSDGCSEEEEKIAW